jgi:SLOG in TRPM, prokaryote
MDRPFTYTFPNKRTAQAIQVQHMEDLPQALHALGIQYPRPTLVLIGGASGISDDEMAHLHRLFQEALAPLFDALGVVVLDGGTDAGTMRLIGNARGKIGASFALIGVAALGTVALTDAALDRPNNELLEPNHSHFILIPGAQWGDESSWIAQVAAEIAHGQPSITLLVNGGEIAWDDITKSVEAQRPVVIIKGSGRTADKLAAAIQGDVVDERAQKLVASGLLQSIDLTNDFDSIIAKMKAYFEGHG